MCGGKTSELIIKTKTNMTSVREYQKEERLNEEEKLLEELQEVEKKVDKLIRHYEKKR